MKGVIALALAALASLAVVTATPARARDAPHV
jgi:hypothetical protein